VKSAPSARMLSAIKGHRVDGKSPSVRRRSMVESRSLSTSLLKTGYSGSVTRLCGVVMVGNSLGVIGSLGEVFEGGVAVKCEVVVCQREGKSGDEKRKTYTCDSAFRHMQLSSEPIHMPLHHSVEEIRVKTSGLSHVRLHVTKPLVTIM
jgi:hypothetical protein